MTFERHPASTVDNAGILWIDREQKRIQRTMRLVSEKFVTSKAFKDMEGILWPKVERIENKWEVEYLEYPMQVMSMTNKQILEAHLFLCDVLKYLNSHNWSMQSHAFNVVSQGNRYMVIDVGDFAPIHPQCQINTLTHCLTGGKIGKREPWLNNHKHIDRFIKNDPFNLEAIKNEFKTVGCKPNQPNQTWDKYSGIYSSIDDMMAKSNNKKDGTVMQYIKEKMPENLTDLGCNTGKLALFAANLGIKSIGLDYAARTIDMADTSRNNLGLDNCQFGFVNLLDPTRVTTYDLPKLKFKSEMTVASALLHHLFRACRDLNRCIDTILDYTTKYVGIEFIPHNDKHMRQAVQNWHTLEQIEERLNFHGYKITEVTESQPSPRQWIFAERS